MSLINWEINLMLTWGVDCVISAADGATKSAITNTKLFIPIVPLSTQDNAKLLQQLKSSFKRTISSNTSKQQALDADLKAIQQINFTANLDQVGETFMIFISDQVKEIILNFS